ncbi:unnamed protein product [Lampetra planeri]
MAGRVELPAAAPAMDASIDGARNAALCGETRGYKRPSRIGSKESVGGLAAHTRGSVRLWGARIGDSPGNPE